MRSFASTRARRLVAAALGLALGAAACTSTTADPTAAPDGTAGPTGGAGIGEVRTAGTGERPQLGGPYASVTDGPLALHALSTRPEYVTGGDLLIGVDLPPGTDPSDATVAVDGAPADVTLAPDRDGRLTGLVTDLPPGEAEVSVSVGERTARLPVTDHPVTGPLFAGPPLPMPVCSGESYGLGPPLDDDCSLPTRVRWRYVSTDGSQKPLDDPAARPADLATVPDSDTPFIIREETGTRNRAIYWITALDPNPDPTATDDPSRWDDRAWNGRLIYEFGGGCGTSYSQGFKLLPPPDPDLLAEGYVFATSTLNTFQVMCNDTLSAETALMVKEHVAETYGEPTFTIGSGGSGGAIQQYLIVQNYPGILDAASPLLPFPDAVSISGGVVDCGLLNRFWREGGASFTDEQRAAVNGHLTTGTCDFWERTFVSAVDPSSGCSLALLNAARGAIGGIPDGGIVGLDDADIYQPDTNPTGLRCTLQDTNVNILGRDPATGFARRPWDNAGVQYGLAALNDGTIDAEQFLALNEGIGSYDLDGRWVPARAEATEDDVRPAYESGKVIEGDGDLRRIPIITVDLWTDPQGDIHDRFRAFAVRDRLRLPDGTDPANAMIWTRGLGEGESLVQSLAGAVSPGTEVIGVLDEWLTALAADTTTDPWDDVLARTRPDAAVDNCITADGERVSRIGLYDEPGPCTDPYPLSGDPRTAAGAPRRDDIVACTRRPVADAITAGVYETTFTDAQRARLDAVFPEGVCDWSVPGLGQVPTAGVWRAY